MAKRKINNYKFKPGIGYTENLYPNGYALLNNNKSFLVAETSAFILNRITDADTYALELVDIINGIKFDMFFGNAAQRLYGEVESRKPDTTKLLRQRTLDRIKTSLSALSNVTGTFQTNIETTITNINSISDGGTSPTLNITDPAGITVNLGYAKTRITNNRAFLIEEVKAYIDTDTPGNAITTDTNFSTDIGLLIDCVQFDLVHQSNILSNAIATYIFVNTPSANRTLLGEGLSRLGVVIKQVIEGDTVTVSEGNSLTQNGTGVNASTAEGNYAQARVDDVQVVTSNGTVASLPGDVAPDITGESAGGQAAATDIDNNLATIIATDNAFKDYTYNQSKCERDVNFILSAYLFDLRYGGNSKTYDYAGKYWEGTVAQVDGTRYPELDTHAWIKFVIKEYIWDKQAYPAEQTGTVQTVSGDDAESALDNRIDTLNSIVLDVIAGGLTALPTFEDTGAGYVKFIGNYDSSDILLITDTVENKVIYSFNDANTGGVTELTTFTSSNGVVYETDPDFPAFLDTADAITKVFFNTSTSTSLSTNKLQIFVDNDELVIRPYEFGTDAIERNRTAEPLSMLDADFEYGLQPTKWSAIATMRGYPSVYEVPGTETDVSQVITDASSGTNDVGSSLITVTTLGAHGLVEGDAITLKGLNPQTFGYSRAEGAFIITTVPNSISFTFYAKAKVGTTDGDSLQSESTQLRKAGFYTGADIGVPTFSVTSQGSNGVVAPALIVPSGEDVIPFTVVSGGAPETGAPVTADTGIPLGTQITGRVGTGGVVTTPVVTADFNEGETAITVQDTAGVVQNLAADRGDGQAMLVNTVVGNTINFNTGITSDFSGNLVTYTAIEGTNVVSLGFGATFDISRSGGTYTIQAIANSGQNYEVDDVLEIQGEFLGGITPTNDAQITVDSVDTGGEILTATISGSAFNGTGNFANITGNYNHGNGQGGIFDITYTNNVFTATLSDPVYNNVTGTSTGGAGTGAIFNITQTNNVYSVNVDPQTIGVTGYAINDIIKIAGTELGGSTPNNDAQISVTSVDSEGYPTGVNIAGVAANAQNTYTGVTYSTNNSGIGAQINVNTNGTGYSATFSQQGTGFAASDTITVLGSQLGGVDGVNDLTITINTVDTGGEILTYTESGTAVNTSSFPNITNHTNLIGSGASFNVTVNNLAETYSVVIDQGGSDYGPNQTIVIPGDQLGGASPANDLTLTITDVDNDSTLVAGPILTVSTSGTSLKATTNYTVEDRLKIPGTQFSGGVDGTNDCIIRVTGVDSDGGITTFTVSGTAPDGNVTYPALAGSTTGSGTAGAFDVTRTGTTYTVGVSNGGANYAALDTVTIVGTDLGGTSPANDATITIDTVDGSGAVLTASIAGTAANVGSADNQSGTALIGNGATFNVALSGGAYTTTVAQGGQEYFAGQTFTVPGNQLAGATPTNDLTITISTVGATGDITAVTDSGSASTDVASFANVVANVAGSTGNGASFDVVRDGTNAASSVGTYTVSLNASGGNYAPGNKIRLDGGNLGGTTSVNDILLTVQTVDSAGAVLTYTYSGAAYAGDDLSLYSTFTIDTQTDAQLQTTLQISFSALATLLITFTTAHGLVPGDTFITTVGSDDGSNNHNLGAGSFLITSVPSATTLTYTARAAGSIDTSNDEITGTVYPRPDSFFVHRPFDGGVQLGTGGPQHGAQAIRQSKKYIRYQSGKGIMYTTGALFAPSYDLRSCTSDGVEVGSTITITCDDNDHGLQIGAKVQLIGIETVGYNGTYTVNDIISERTFEVSAVNRLGDTTAVLSFGAQVSTYQWHGATVRSGVFDDQNGIYWEYDGTNLLACQRTATKQVSGTGTINPDENTVNGTNTRFRDQLKAGDRVVIRGMTHVVTSVVDQTTMTVSPDYRGVNTATGTKICLISDKKVRQRDFNIDAMDGNGPSGYNFVASKMQMIGIEYSWYGAGFIDYMVRGADGNFVYAHRIRNSNVNTEAYMRSGNLPVRYEITNEGQNTKLSADIDDAVTTIPVESVEFLPEAGTVYIDNELVAYTGLDTANNTLTGCTRSANLTNFQSGAQRTYTAGAAISHTERTGVVLVSNTTTPLISHWGSAFITDGGFDEDRGYIFSYTETNITVTNSRQTAFMIRLAPSVSNAIPGDLGDRELLNRAQLLLQSLEITTDQPTASDPGTIVVEGILNPQNYPVNPNLISWSGLSTLAQGGQPSFAQVASGTGITWTTGASTTTANLTAQATIQAVLDSGQNRSNNGNSFIWVSAVDYRTTFGTNLLDIVTGKTIIGNNIPNGAYITGGYISPSSNYGYFFISQNITGNIQRNVSNAYTIQSHSDLNNAPNAFITKASWEASGGTNGTAVSSTSSNPSWPAGTVINKISLEDFAGTEYYQIEFNQAAQGTLQQGSGTITLEFSAPAYGQPGETVLSFISQPGERATLSLAELKELTNTTLGGRGTFPNGPDVLAINIYKTSGADIGANLILRWGEAQA